jgi:uncharacterized pyridoxamine 5'-phosphate oxidase family protein
MVLSGGLIVSPLCAPSLALSKLQFCTCKIGKKMSVCLAVILIFQKQVMLSKVPRVTTAYKADRNGEVTEAFYLSSEKETQAFLGIV